MINVQLALHMAVEIVLKVTLFYTSQISEYGLLQFLPSSSLR